MDVRKIRQELRPGRSFYDLPLRVTFYARVSTDMDANRMEVRLIEGMRSDEN